MAKYKDILVHRCSCGRHFKKSKGLTLHKTKADHWVYPKPEPERPVMTTFADLMILGQGQWGAKLLKSQRKSPTDAQLVFGYLEQIWATLLRIEKHIKRPWKS